MFDYAKFGHMTKQELLLNLKQYKGTGVTYKICDPDFDGDDQTIVFSFTNPPFMHCNFLGGQVLRWLTAVLSILKKDRFIIKKQPVTMAKIIRRMNVICCSPYKIFST